jgi:hypothetical protein
VDPLHDAVSVRPTGQHLVGHTSPLWDYNRLGVDDLDGTFLAVWAGDNRVENGLPVIFTDLIQ